MDHDHIPPPAPASDEHHHVQEDENIAITTTPRRRKSSVAFAGDQDHQDHQEQLQAGDHDKNERLQKMTTKKMTHRDLERQRRQDTKAHYASLRSLLPLEYLKGKRSISDQVHQAAIYICHKDAKIRELTGKRDQLLIIAKNPPSIITSSSSPSPSSSLPPSTSNLEMSDNCAISVDLCLVGEEVVMEIGLVTKTSAITNNKKSGVSIVFGALIRQGLDIVSYNSTNVGDKMIHSIKAKECDGRSINAAQLQQNLTASLSLITRPQTKLPS